MALAQRSTELLHGLPRGWTAARLELTVEDPGQADRAALILGPAAPGRRGTTFRLTVYGPRERMAPGPGLLRRCLRRLDEEEIRGRLKLVTTRADGRAEPEVTTEPLGLAVAWDRLVERLPADWSHLYAEVTLDSSDWLERAALLLAPANPLRQGGIATLRFRCAQRVGYGVAVEMARRCLERLDRERITGRLRVVRVVSDAHPQATQGPVWHVEGRTV